MHKLGNQRPHAPREPLLPKLCPLRMYQTLCRCRRMRRTCQWSRACATLQSKNQPGRQQPHLSSPLHGATVGTRVEQFLSELHGPGPGYKIQNGVEPAFQKMAVAWPAFEGIVPMMERREKDMVTRTELHEKLEPSCRWPVRSVRKSCRLPVRFTLVSQSVENKFTSVEDMRIKDRECVKTTVQRRRTKGPKGR